jgi:hypothetical protein
MKRRGLEYLSLPAMERALASEMGLTIGHVDGYHPDAAGAKVYARAYFDRIKEREKMR